MGCDAFEVGRWLAVCGVVKNSFVVFQSEVILLAAEAAFSIHAVFAHVVTSWWCCSPVLGEPTGHLHHQRCGPG